MMNENRQIPMAGSSDDALHRVPGLLEELRRLTEMERWDRWADVLREIRAVLSSVERYWANRGRSSGLAVTVADELLEEVARIRGMLEDKRRAAGADLARVRQGKIARKSYRNAATVTRHRHRPRLGLTC